MELTASIFTSVERTIADRLSIYRGGPYHVGCYLDSQGRLQISVEGTVDGNRIGYAWSIDRQEIEACDEATFTRLVEFYAERHFERPLVEYLRSHPAPARTIPQYGSVNVNVDGVRFEGVESINYGAVNAPMSRLITPFDRWQVFRQMIDTSQAYTIPAGSLVEWIEPKPEPIRVSRYQALAEEWFS